MTPTYEELLQGATTWKGEYKDVSYQLSHHGYRKGSDQPYDEFHPGIWCYYLLIPEQMYPHRWDDFRINRKESGFTEHGPAFDHDMFDTEITFARCETYFDRKTERNWEIVKVGCDYAHLWHMERGYPDTYESVKRDAEITIDKFLIANPDFHIRCGYSGIWDTRENFYEAINGRLIHISKENEIDDGWDTWKRKEE